MRWCAAARRTARVCWCSLAAKVHFDDRRWRSLLEAIKGDPARVRVGVLAKTAHDHPPGSNAKGEISLMELAAIHEFGSPAAGIPERSFIRSTVNGKRAEINGHIEKIVGGAMKKLLAREVLHSHDVREAVKHSLGLLGTRVAAMMRATIRARQTTGPEAQALKPATIARKGSTLPLVDTGQMINAITYEVVDGHEGGVE